jgi:HPr kinase/phosphorylase
VILPDSQTLHATCVSVEGRGLLIIGPSGAGKSSLAIRLMALGASLVSDDQTTVRVQDGQLWANCPAPAMSGLIEARGLGILRAPVVAGTALVLVADLSRLETDRLPPVRHTMILGCELPLVLQVQKDHFPAALMLYLRHGRQA